MGDQEMKTQIVEAVARINTLLDEACKMGVEVELEVLDIRTFSDPVEHLMLNVKLMKLI